MKNKIILFVIFNLYAFHAYTQDSLTFLALGDSYTIGESVDKSMNWPMLLADSLNKKGYMAKTPTIIAKTGWRTDQLKSAIEAAKLKSAYDLVGLLIGVNNQYQGKSIDDYASEFKELLKTAIQYANGKPSNVFVFSIPDYGYTPFGEKNQKQISAELDHYNLINSKIASDFKVKYYNITEISRNRDQKLVANDDLHPSGFQYALWVESILKDASFFEMINKK